MSGYFLAFGFAFTAGLALDFVVLALDTAALVPGTAAPGGGGKLLWYFRVSMTSRKITGLGSFLK